ncbi:hypothetical protein FQA39_LY12936 [Lamprigera yunnana]|nr:hypothetical protein FQA39_LY12936 [Lamprigera yunnana]
MLDHYKLQPYTTQPGSGTRSSFETLTHVTPGQAANVYNNNGGIFSQLSRSQGSIGFMSMNYVFEIQRDHEKYKDLKMVIVGDGAPSNDNLMVAATTMAFMAIPTMVSLSYNAVRSVPEGYRMAALGLGITVIMGMARVIGETMAIMMIAGNSTGGLNTSDGLGGFYFLQLEH